MKKKVIINRPMFKCVCIWARSASVSGNARQIQFKMLRFREWFENGISFQRMNASIPFPNITNCIKAIVAKDGIFDYFFLVLYLRPELLFVCQKLFNWYLSAHFSAAFLSRQNKIGRELNAIMRPPAWKSILYTFRCISYINSLWLFSNANKNPWHLVDFI